MTNLERIESLLEDVNRITANYPISNNDLVQIILEYDIPWLVNYVSKVENFIKLAENPSNQTTETNFMTGYFSAIRDLKRELNEITDN